MDFSTKRSRLVDRDTLLSLARSISDGDLGLQLALVKLQGLMSHTDPVPDEVYAECGAALATLRQSCTKLETFLFTLSEQT